jgi:flagellar export protein FliJ
VQAQLKVQQMQAAVDLAASRVKAARLDVEKMKKLVERETKRIASDTAKTAQRRMDEMATLRHSYKHA